MSTTKLIVDTDIGSDIDDSYALCMLLKWHGAGIISLQLIVSCCGDVKRRVNQFIVPMLNAFAKDGFEQQVSRISVVAGLASELNPVKYIAYEPQDDTLLSHSKLDVSLEGDAVDKMLQLINKNVELNEITTILCLGPMTNIAELLRRQPAVARHVRIVAMSGAVHKGYRGSPTVHAEFNVKQDVKSAQIVYGNSDWFDFIITPLDTCGIVTLRGNQWNTVIQKAQSGDQLLSVVMDQFKQHAVQFRNGVTEESSIMYDPVAAFLVLRESFLVIKPMSLSVTDDGFTVLNKDEKGPTVRVATEWKDMSGFKNYLVQVLTQ